MIMQIFRLGKSLSEDYATFIRKNDYIESIWVA